jgi:hypothetical protein
MVQHMPLQKQLATKTSEQATNPLSKVQWLITAGDQGNDQTTADAGKSVL